MTWCERQMQPCTGQNAKGVTAWLWRMKPSRKIRHELSRRVFLKSVFSSVLSVVRAGAQPPLEQSQEHMKGKADIQGQFDIINKIDPLHLEFKTPCPKPAGPPS